MQVPVNPKSPLALSLFCILSLAGVFSWSSRAPPWTETSQRLKNSSASSSRSSRTSTMKALRLSPCRYSRYPDTLRRSALAGWLWSSWISARLSLLEYSRTSCMRPVYLSLPSAPAPILTAARPETQTREAFSHARESGPR